ncbi:MAG: transposase [Geminicoccaceae bacterium]|nr:transposase [Geminicoccaceae bacterium]
MPRAPRTDVGGLVYHVLNRANARASLFDDAGDYRHFTTLLAEERSRAGMRLLAWCLMPNHWHLVLWPRADGDLGRFVRRLTQRHTQARHRHRGTLGQGHLYQGRYKAFLVQDDAHLLTVCRYVERNPLRAGLVASARDWPHGSLPELRRRGATRLLDPWPLPRPPGWAKAVNRPETPFEIEALRRSVQRGTPYGEPAWVAAMADRFTLRSTLRPHGRPPRSALTDDSANE